MRTKEKDLEHFKKFITECDWFIETFKESLIKPDAEQGEVNNASRALLKYSFMKMNAQYSSGADLEPFKEDLVVMLDLMEQYFAGGHNKFGRGKEPDIHTYNIDIFDQLLWTLSIAFMLGLPEAEFQKFAKVLEIDQVEDKLFNFILAAAIEDRGYDPEMQESHITKIRQTLKTAFTAEPEEAQKIVKQYISPVWMREHRSAGWYGTHKGPGYSGYWCYEAAAVTCILGLDDSFYRDHKYYPKDLVDYYRANH
ncbi:PoNe immunity protein domain-containing protein [Rubritalea marina]|uniref:PoNe immunity protein domain-containing protein n=1 Tax=Rubritalea marina TaxID=361055 RepID=UPI000380171D|nr:PoNe immunity protein domain-containing protein [Rubritalea marina]